MKPKGATASDLMKAAKQRRAGDHGMGQSIYQMRMVRTSKGQDDRYDGTTFAARSYGIVSLGPMPDPGKGSAIMKRRAATLSGETWSR